MVTLDGAALMSGFFSAIVDRRAEDVSGWYVDSPDTYAFLEGPRWSTLGVAEIGDGWRAFMSSALSIVNIEWIEGPVAEGEGDLAWVAGIVELFVEIRRRQLEAPEPQETVESRLVRLRSTFILRRDDLGRFRIRHEHFSVPAEDPYGIADWKKKVASS